MKAPVPERAVPERKVNAQVSVFCPCCGTWNPIASYKGSPRGSMRGPLVQQLWKLGMTTKEIARQLGWNWHSVRKMIWYQQHQQKHRP